MFSCASFTQFFFLSIVNYKGSDYLLTPSGALSNIKKDIF